MSHDEHSPAPLTLPTTALAARLARRHVATIGASWPADLRDLALLLTSELVTNALRYGNGGGIRLTVRRTPHLVRVEVQDANPAPPELFQNLDGTAEQGRGLHIIDSLATRWGHTPSAHPAGKTVWFELHHRQTAGDDHSE
jgi:anti-sigma regulatory factor (Ser/Thr protein kinase)